MEFFATGVNGSVNGMGLSAAGNNGSQSGAAGHFMAQRPAAGPTAGMVAAFDFAGHYARQQALCGGQNAPDDLSMHNYGDHMGNVGINDTVRRQRSRNGNANGTIDTSVIS